jgi:hypothetical protein
MQLDPYARAKALGITLFFRPMDWASLWFHSQLSIVLRQNMTLEEEMRALAECLDHVETGSREVNPHSD